MSAWWNTNAEHQAEHGCKPGDTWQPLPKLCLLSRAELNAWSRKPGHTNRALGTAYATYLQLNGDAPARFNRPAINS